VATVQVAVVSAIWTFASLVFWAVVPMVLGWDSNVVVSGSMTPNVLKGDVVVTAEAPDKDLRPGHILLFDDVSRPGGVPVLHRMVRRNDDGTITTRGDANASEDSTPVAPDKVRGLARLRVPFVGLPALWMRDY
jgi:signal peptidase